MRSRADEIAKRTMTDAQAWHSENDYPRGDGDGSIRRMHNEWMEAELACARVVPADLGAGVVYATVVLVAPLTHKRAAGGLDVGPR